MMFEGMAKRNPRTCREVMQTLYHAATMGCRAPRHLRKYMYMQLVVWGLFLYLWVTFNGGLLPWFLKNAPVPNPIQPDVSILDFFPETEQDGSKVIWGCQLNSRDSLEQAVKSDIMMLEGDIMLKGQGTDNQQMVLVMANPPLVTGDLTLLEWLGIAQPSGKGMKLEFKSIEAVELSLQTLNGMKDRLHVPIWLHADVLEGPNSALSDAKLVDAARFIRLVTTSFTKSTISLGWKVGWSEDGNNYGYDWKMVKSMYDLFERWEINQPLTYSIRAGQLLHSVPQVKWLMEMTGATMTLWSDEHDQVPVNDLLYIRYKLPANRVFFDLPESLKMQFDSIKEEAAMRVSDEMKSLDTLSFQADQWKVVKSKQGEMIYLGTESVMLRRGLLITKEEYKPMSIDKNLKIIGRVDFLDIPPEAAEKSKKDPNAGVPGIEIFLYATQATRVDSISGLRCFIGLDGVLRISSQSIPGIDVSKEASMFGKSNCAKFEITEKNGEKVSMVVTRPMDCSNPSPQEFATGSVDLPLADIKGKLGDSGYIALRVSSSSKFAAIHQFKIEH